MTMSKIWSRQFYQSNQEAKPRNAVSSHYCHSLSASHTRKSLRAASRLLLRRGSFKPNCNVSSARTIPASHFDPRPGQGKGGVTFVVKIEHFPDYCLFEKSRVSKIGQSPTAQQATLQSGLPRGALHWKATFFLRPVFHVEIESMIV
jgi:hypothetical protein